MGAFSLKQSNSDLGIMTLSTVLAVIFSDATVYYVVYMFWWHELITQITGRIFGKKEQTPQISSVATVIAPIFFMFIYLIFINIFFGYLANYDNKEYVYQNMRVFLFKNWFFNLYLVFTIIESIYLFRSGKKKLNASQFLSPNMIVLHISIILGALMISFVTSKYKSFFDGEQTIKTLVEIAPFLLIRYLAYRYFDKAEQNQSESKNVNNF